MVSVGGRSRNRLYRAVGDGFACLPVAWELGLSVYCEMQIGVVLLCEIDYEMNM